jgi:uncharacterized membrane protein YuzA (DUF378 family)
MNAAPGPTRSDQPHRRSGITLPGTLALVLVAVGGLNWGFVGIADVDLVAALFGRGSVATRAIYVAVGLAAVYCLVKLPDWSRAG